ncbi:formylglycine-generating enzyme family protein [Palleronia salina]|nr:formylglycine-generating enzyme family protein [Palleronia salina]
MTGSCCGMAAVKKPRGNGAATSPVQPADAATRAALAKKLVAIPGGFFDMGARQSRFPGDHDAPRRRVKLAPFRISHVACSNAQFARFVAATGHVTLAEAEGWSSVFAGLLDRPDDWPQSPPGLPWWRRVEGACWRAPRGPGSVALDDHPVVHVTWHDAQAYCRWAGLCLPTEAQWERAARGGLDRRKFPWGSEMRPGGRIAMNVFEGAFPVPGPADTGTVPVTAFAPNGYGLYNTCGNVWEWVADRFADAALPKGPLSDPTGPDTGPGRVQRGGSYLCHASYCDRYFVHSRTANDPGSPTGNAGFRVAAPA